MSLDTVNLTMAGLVFAQGAHGFLTTKSKPALMMGLLIGGLYAASAYCNNDKSTASRGYVLAALTSVALAGRMGHYYYQ